MSVLHCHNTLSCHDPSSWSFPFHAQPQHPPIHFICSTASSLPSPIHFTLFYHPTAQDNKYFIAVSPSFLPAAWSDLALNNFQLVVSPVHFTHPSPQNSFQPLSHSERGLTSEVGNHQMDICELLNKMLTNWQRATLISPLFNWRKRSPEQGSSAGGLSRKQATHTHTHRAADH